MVPFADVMYSDVIRIRRAFKTSDAGRKVVDYLPPAPPIAASVQSERIERVEPTSGRLTVVMMHVVRTAENPIVKPDDMAVWVDGSGVSHDLIAVGPSIARGIGDVEYSTDFIERV